MNVNDATVTEGYLQLIENPRAAPLLPPLHCKYFVVSVYPGVVYPGNPDPEVVCENWFRDGTLYMPPTAEEAIVFLAIPGLAGSPGGLARMLTFWRRVAIENVERHDPPLDSTESLHEALVDCRPEILLTYMSIAGFQGWRVEDLKENALEEEEDILDIRNKLLAGERVYLPEQNPCDFGGPNHIFNVL